MPTPSEQYIPWLDQIERERDELRAEVERLRAALALVMPVCRDCGDPLGIDDLDIEQPGEDGVWVHQACQT